MGKLALEEHVVLDREDHLDRWRTLVPMIPEPFVQRLIAQLTDTSRRLEVMDTWAKHCPSSCGALISAPAHSLITLPR